MKDTQTLEAARVVAFRFLGYAARSKAEIERRLEKSGFPPEIIASVVEECVTRGWVNDTEFAQRWIEDRADRKQYGRSRLAAELQRKGVDRETMKTALSTIAVEDEVERALAAARTKYHPERLANADNATLQAEKRKLSGFLQRRGFGWSTISQVLAKLTASEEE